MIASYRDRQLVAGKSANTVRLELALLFRLFTIAIKEWQLGLTYIPIMNICKAPAKQGRDRRYNTDEVRILVEAGLGDKDVAAISGHESMQMFKH